MSLTKIGSIGINTGIAFAGVTTIVTLNTANDALSIGATVNVGSGITLGASGDIFATGVSTFSGNLKVGSGVTISPDGDGFYTGVVTATSYYGDGSNLSNITSTTINSNADNRLITGSGTANTLNGESNLTFDGSTLTVTGSIDLSSHLDMGDSDVVKLGDGDDFQLYHDGSNSYVTNSTGNLYINGNGTEKSIACVPDGTVELYYNNSKKLETTNTGVSITGKLETTTFISVAADNQDLKVGAGDDIKLFHDGTDSFIHGTAGTRYLKIRAAETRMVNEANSEIIARFIEDGAVELYHNNIKKLQTNDTYGTILSNTTDNAAYTNALLLTRRGYETSGYGVIFQAKGGSISSQNGLNIRLGTGSGSYLDKFTLDNDGLKFGGDTAAANALDDYEEGAWTVSLLSGGTSIAEGGSGNNRYVKIGSMVFLTFEITTLANPDGNTFEVGNLPYAVASSREGTGSCMSNHITYGTNRTMITTYAYSGQSKLRFYTSGNATNWRAITGSDFTVSGSIIGTIAYHTV